MRKLTPEEIVEFLAGPVVARVATVDEEGLPYITPVWEEWDGAALWIVPHERSVWVRHLLTHPQVAISCALDNSPYTRRPHARQGGDRGRPRTHAGQVPGGGQPHGGALSRRAGPEYLVPTLDRPRYLIKFTPDKITSWEGVEWAEKYTK